MFASYSVDDISAARQFYGELGFQVTSASDEYGPLWLTNSKGRPLVSAPLIGDSSTWREGGPHLRRRRVEPAGF